MADKQIIAIVKELEGFVGELAKKLNLNITAGLQKDTPVDTGWARINWVPSLITPFSRTAGSRAAAELGSLDPSPQAQGIAQIAQYKFGVGDIFITNNVDYIGKLNMGTSAQAPAYFVETRIEREIVALGGKV